MISNVDSEELRFKKIRLERVEKILNSSVSYHVKMSATNYVYRELFKNDEDLGIFFNTSEDLITFERADGSTVIFRGDKLRRS